MTKFFGMIAAALVAVCGVGVMLMNRGSKGRVLSKAELALYDSEASTIYMGIMGEVFDVTSGAQYYAKGNGYDFFAGVDGSKAFVTGDFENDVHDDVSSLSPADLLNLQTWVNATYYAKYIYVGLLDGFFYDKRGQPTSGKHKIDAIIQQEIIDAEKRKTDEEIFPKCNSRRSKTENIVWCDHRHVPRRRSVFGGQERCACFPTPADADQDLRNLPYDNCPPTNSTCSR